MAADEHRIADLLRPGSEGRENDVNCLWTVYDHPTDYPDWFVARQFLVPSHPTHRIILAKTVEEIHERLGRYGMMWWPRDESDEPQIMGCYL